LAFQAAQQSAVGAGDPQVAFATLGADASADHWTQNVAAPSDPDNFLDMRDGATSIQWTGAPLLDEAVYVAADEAVIHFRSKQPGDIGNERTILSDGLWIQVDADPTVVGTIRARVFFGATNVIESFGQAPTLDDLVDAINDPRNGSTFITATLTDDAGIFDADLTVAQNVGLSGAFTNADVVGTKVGSVTTGLQKFRNPDIVPFDWIMVPGQWHAPVIVAIQSLCERRGVRAIGIVPTPDSDDVFETRDFVNAEYNSGPGLPPVPTALVPFPPTVAIDSSQLAVFDPWVTYLDQFTNETVSEPPDGDVAALVANTDSVAHPWFPIAGGRRGRVQAEGVKYSTELDDRNLVHGLVGNRTEIINSIVAFSGRGLQLTGQRTGQRAATALDRINVRWTLNVIMNKLDQGAKEFQFELNDTILWRQIKAFIESILGPIKERRGLQDYFVIVDQTTTTANDIDNLTVRAKIFIKPARAAEFLDFDIILTPTGADFADVSSASTSAI
ncbi:MAG TPA: phage tail sheath C-terminal domain-containing protein, partial [Planctomycetota bacterium]|nr:phage tail sheath C-terminal domain-containing protein [Planctomycetota bacterium]